MKVKGIARYAHLIKPSAPKGSDKMKYSIQILLHKTDPQCKEIEKAISDTFNNKWPSTKPKKIHTCFKDCAIEEPENTALKDYMSLKCATSAEFDRPVIVDEKMQPIIDPNHQIEGQIVWVNVNINAYEHPMNSGVAAYLQGTLVMNEKGSLPVESIISKPSAESLFSDVINSTPSASPISPVSPPPAPPAAIENISPYVMTEKAEGRTRDEFLSAGWTDEMMIKEGFMLPPNGVTPSFS